MLPDLLLPVVIDGEPLAFRAWDVPAWLYLYEMPDGLPGAECFTRNTTGEQRRIVSAWESWASDVLTRIVAEPVLTRETVAQLGSDRDALLLAYQRAIGWLPPDDDAPPIEPVARNRGALRARLATLMRPRTWVPGPAVQEVITILAAKTRLDAWRLQERPISEWVWLYRVHAEEFLKRRRRGGQHVPPEMAAIGTTA